MSSSRAAALTVSLGLHALVAWAVTSTERTANPTPRLLPMSAYLVPLPPEPLEAPLPMPEPPPAVEEPPTVEPEPEPVDAPLEPADTPASSDGGDAEADAAERPVRSAPRRRDIDWNRSISQAIARVRERERQGYRSFGRALPEPDRDAPKMGGLAKRGEPWRSQRPGETITTGTQQVQINDNCYYEVYAPGSLLEEAHRFSNPMASCKPSGPAEPRNDLFLDARPDYLDLHLAEDAAGDAQSGP